MKKWYLSQALKGGLQVEREAVEGEEAPESTDSLPGLSSALFPFNIPMKIEVSGKIGRGRH